MNIPPTASVPAAVHSAKPRSLAGFNRDSVLRGLRRLHVWIGLRVAVLGLLFGIGGILLNHRAMLKISAEQTEKYPLNIVPRFFGEQYL